MALAGVNLADRDVGGLLRPVDLAHVLSHQRTRPTLKLLGMAVGVHRPVVRECLFNGLDDRVYRRAPDIVDPNGRRAVHQVRELTAKRAMAVHPPLRW
jgi:hypothetical protein